MKKVLLYTLGKMWLTLSLSLACGCSHKYKGCLVPIDGVFASELKKIQKQSAFKDSIIGIMKKPQKIVCNLGCANPIDSSRLDITKVLPMDMYPILDFLFWDPKNFESNEIVFGKFCPNVNYVVEGRGNNKITLQFDFGLKKWRILDSNSNLILCADLKDENNSILRFTRVVFPEDTTLQFLNNNIISISK